MTNRDYQMETGNIKYTNSNELNYNDKILTNLSIYCRKRLNKLNS